VAADMWMRATLTREPISEEATFNFGGWDGSGLFEFGETEDYQLFDESDPDVPLIGPPPIPPCQCVFKLRGMPDPLVLFHNQVGKVRLRLTIRGAGCSGRLDGVQVLNQGPLMGWGVLQGAGGAAGAPVPGVGAIFGAPGVYNIDVPITPVEHDIGAIQSFSIKFRVSGWCAGNKVFAGTKTIGVLIIHPAHQQVARLGVLSFGPDSPNPPFAAISIPPVPGLSGVPGPESQIIFDGPQNTSGTLTVAEVQTTPPGLPDGQRDFVKHYWIWSLTFAPDDENLPEGEDEIRTGIQGMILRGYSPLDIPPGVDEQQLCVGRMPFFSQPSFFDIFTEFSSDVGLGYFVDTFNHQVYVQHPKGFSIWTMYGPDAFTPENRANPVWLEMD
jgi:hypothetical protein